MSDRTLCQTGCGEPTSAVLCKRCAHKTEEAIAMLASWAQPAPPVRVGTATPGNMPKWHAELAENGPTLRPLPPSNGSHGSRPSSPFDSPAGRAMLGGTRGLASELDVVRARQTRRGDQAGPRPAPDSKVWAPNRRTDRAEERLADTVRFWIATLHGVNVDAPRSVVTGHVLARGCTWLLWHVHDVVTHPRAADAHAAFTRAADDIVRLVDRPEDRVYVGPCWRQSVEVLPEGFIGPAAIVECPENLYLPVGPAVMVVACKRCGNEVPVKERRQWLVDHLEDEEQSAANASRALATVGLAVSGELIRQWAKRGHVKSTGRKSVDGRSQPVYRIGDLMARATFEVQHPAEARAERRKVSA